MNSWLNSSENVVNEIKPTPSTSKITSLSKPKKTVEMKDEVLLLFILLSFLQADFL